MKCSYCKGKIPSNTRYVIGLLHGRYHVFCAGKAGLKNKLYAWRGDL